MIAHSVNHRSPAREIYTPDEQTLVSFDGKSGFAHGCSVAVTIQLGRNLKRDDLHPKNWNIRIEANHFDIGEPLSPEIIEKASQVSQQLDTKMIIMSHLTCGSSSFE